MTSTSSPTVAHEPPDHGAVAEALERHYGERAMAHAGQLAFHYVRAATEATDAVALKTANYLRAAGADAAAGTYPSMEVAKAALHSAMTPGSDWPRFEQH